MMDFAQPGAWRPAVGILVWANKAQNEHITSASHRRADITTMRREFGFRH